MLFLLLTLILVSLTSSFSAFWSYVKPTTKFTSDITPDDLGLPYENVSFSTEDNIELQGWFIPSSQENAKTVIALHGWPTNKGSVLPSISFLTQTHNLFLFDFRFLGESGGSYSTVGARETEDLRAAIRYLKSRGIEEAGVWGVSMGGAVALMTAPQNPEIKAIVSDASYASLYLMTFEAFRAPPPLKYPLVYSTDLWARLFFGTGLKNVSPADSAEQLAIPVLIIHSKKDEVIPFSHALLLQKALSGNPKAEFWFQEDLLHGQLSPEYQHRVLDFFERNL